MSELTKRILLLGAGAVARPCAEYVTRQPENILTVGTSTLVCFMLRDIGIIFHMSSVPHTEECTGDREWASERDGDHARRWLRRPGQA